MAGFVNFGQYESAPVVKIISLYVHSDFMRQGLGAELFKLGLQKLNDLNYSDFVLLVDVKNYDAIGLYTKYGFKDSGKREMGTFVYYDEYPTVSDWDDDPFLREGEQVYALYELDNATFKKMMG